MPRLFPVAGAALALALAAGCTKTVSVDLSLVEPCDQKDQALNGVSSFTVSSTGSTLGDNAVSFSIDQGVAPLDVGLGNVVITVQAFADDVSAGGAGGALPQSVGRTVPLPITEASGDFKSIVVVGERDSFGKTTGADGKCTSMTASAAVKGRHGHTATFIPGLNKVLIFGGAVFEADGVTEDFLSSAELYDPATGTFEELPDTGISRAYHAATALPDGRVLITGGLGIQSGHVIALANGVVFDPQLGADFPYQNVGLVQARAHHTQTLLEGAGIIVVTGGCVRANDADHCTTTQAGAGGVGKTTESTGADGQVHALVTETFNIKDAVLASTPVPPNAGLTHGRAFHQATALGSGTNEILVVSGGADADGPVPDIEVFRAANGELAHVAGTEGNIGFPQDKVPVRHAAVAIDDQRILMIGGQTEAPDGLPSGPASADVFFFSTAAGVDRDHPVELLQGGRTGALAAQMSDGSIVVIGGPTAPGQPAAEVLRPGVGTGLLTAEPLSGPPLGQARDHAALTVLPNNELLYSGGHTTSAPFTTTNAVDVYFGD